MFCDRDTWSQGTPLVEVETVNDRKDDEQYTGIARRYMRITGLGSGKHPHDVACDEVETLASLIL
jgi:hypothetical protein